MPEEINRVITDHISDFLFCPTKKQEQILIQENIQKKRIFVTGNTIVDAVNECLKIANRKSKILEAYGLNKVLHHVGVEPSGDTFNSIILQKDTNRPFNPMINAGAITIAALLYDHYGQESFDFILDRFSKAAGRQLSLDKNVYQSELNTGHRNRAIGHLLLNFGMIGEHVDKYLDLYFKQCSILVNCHDLAMMSATLANLGTQPKSQTEIYQFGTVKDILSIMLTCGMYDYSGEWAFRVGVPAKSGVGGGVIATVNRQMGLAVYSPRLDDRGNSARGINVCIDLANEFGLHAFDCMNHGSDYLKAIL